MSTSKKRPWSAKRKAAGAVVPQPLVVEREKKMKKNKK
jgi:hypothetical protein